MMREYGSDRSGMLGRAVMLLLLASGANARLDAIRIMSRRIYVITQPKIQSQIFAQFNGLSRRLARSLAQWDAICSRNLGRSVLNG